MVILGVKEHEWPLYVSNAFRILKPGTGWAQFSECADLVTLMEGRVPPDGALQQVLNLRYGINGSSSTLRMDISNETTSSPVEVLL